MNQAAVATTQAEEGAVVVDEDVDVVEDEGVEEVEEDEATAITTTQGLQRPTDLPMTKETARKNQSTMMGQPLEVPLPNVPVE